MAEEMKDASSESCKTKCGGCKFVCGVVIGLLVAGTGFGLFMAGRCAQKSGMCPITGQPMQQMQQPQAKPAK